MNIKTGLLALTGSLLFQLNAISQDTNFFVFLCFGRSNMENGGRIMAELPKTLPGSYVISSAGCTCNADRMHFNAAGSGELGKRYGETMLSVLGYRKGEPR